jgi:hypothetical protein
MFDLKTILSTLIVISLILTSLYFLKYIIGAIVYCIDIVVSNDAVFYTVMTSMVLIILTSSIMFCHFMFIEDHIKLWGQ